MKLICLPGGPGPADSLSIRMAASHPRLFRQHGERCCILIFRRSRHPECPVGPKTCRDLAETAPFRLFPGGLDTRISLQGRFHGATSPSGGNARTQEDAGTPRGPSGGQFAGQHSSAAPRHPVACSAQPLINQQFKGIIYLLSTETP